MDLKNYIKAIENFPKEGIIFRDVTPLMQDGKAYKEAINKFVEFAKETLIIILLIGGLNYIIVLEKLIILICLLEKIVII